MFYRNLENSFSDLAALSKHMHKMRKESDERKLSIRKAIPPEYYRWRIFENPIHEGQNIVAEDERNEIICCFARTYRRFHYRHKSLQCNEVGDAYATRSARGKGVFKECVRRILVGAEQENVSLIYAWPNRVALPIYEKKFGFGRPKNVWQVNVVKPIPTEKMIKYYLKAKLMSFGLAKFLLQITLAHNFLIGRINCKYKVSQIPSLAEIGNTIFEAASKAFDIIIIRDKDYLSWRFEKNVDDYFYFVAKLRDFPVGYVVLKKAFWGGLKVIYVADFLTLPSHKSCFYSMLSTVYQFALHEKADMISCWVNKCGPYYKSLLFSGYMPFKAMPFIIHPMGKGELFLNDRLSWHLTMSDSDNI